MTIFFGEIIERYETVALRYLESRLKDPEAARDIYQEVLAAILNSRKTFSSMAHLRNYFFVALRNASIDHAKARLRAREVALPDGIQAERAVWSGGESPVDLLIAEEEFQRERERLRALQTSLNGLSERERDLLRLRFCERKTFREIQEVTGDPISTLKSREDATLKKLKKMIGKVGSEE